MICPIMSRNVKGFQVVNFYPVECLKEQCMAWCKEYKADSMVGIMSPNPAGNTIQAHCKLIDKN